MSLTSPSRFWPLLLLLLCGCGEQLNTEYGQRRGLASGSVNGTSVFSEMFQQRGHHVSSWRWLSPKLRERADVIVWFPDDFSPPSDQVGEWLEGWLSEGAGRTLIYVGRDFDAAPDYWTKALPLAPPEKQAEFRSQLTAALGEELLNRGIIPAHDACPWFVLDGTRNPRDVRTLQGDAAWTDGIDPAQLEMKLIGRFAPPADSYPTSTTTTTSAPPTSDADADADAEMAEEPGDAESIPVESIPEFPAESPEPSDGLPVEIGAPDESQFIPEEYTLDENYYDHPGNDWPSDVALHDHAVLLSSEGDPLIMRQQMGSGQIFVVTNGSFLLNLPLVNHEHRKLASRLVDQVTPGDRVVFLESSYGGPPIFQKEPSTSKSGLEIFEIWPFNYIFAHFAALGLIYCFFRWPIFGIPRRLSHHDPADFSQHVTAVGSLLERSHDTAYATNRIQEYRESVRSATHSRQGKTKA
jgi:hypothetical protein